MFWALAPLLFRLARGVLPFALPDLPCRLLTAPSGSASRVFRLIRVGFWRANRAAFSLSGVSHARGCFLVFVATCVPFLPRAPGARALSLGGLSWLFSIFIPRGGGLGPRQFAGWSGGASLWILALSIRCFESMVMVGPFGLQAGPEQWVPWCRACVVSRGLFWSRLPSLAPLSVPCRAGGVMGWLDWWCRSSSPTASGFFLGAGGLHS